MKTERALTLSEFALFAMETARAAGAVTLSRLSASMNVKQVTFKKGSDDLVTQADRDGEQVIAEAIRRRYPDHGLIGEEGSRVAGDEFRWIADPIDGTTNFVHGLPWFAVSLALARGDQIIVGVVYHPSGDELFVAERGAGAHLVDRERRARRLAVSKATAVNEALVGMGLPSGPERARQNPLLSEFSSRTREIRIMGSAALHLADVAAGREEAFVEPHLSAWDIAAGILLVEEAGGRVTDFSGDPLPPAAQPDMGGDVVASNGRVHDALLGVLRGR